jgi:hypothetical protein
MESQEGPSAMKHIMGSAVMSS